MKGDKLCEATLACAILYEVMFIGTTGTLQSPNRANADFQKCAELNRTDRNPLS
jgi:hypothetical protein